MPDGARNSDGRRGRETPGSWEAGLHTHPHDHHHVSDDQLEVCGGGRVVHQQLYEAVRLVTGVVGEQGLREHGEAGQR